MNDVTQKSDNVILRYRARDIRSSDIEFIQKTIKEHFKLSRSKISRILCEKWDWRQLNGKLKTTPCLDLLLQLEARGYIDLPPVTGKRNFLQSRKVSRQEELDLFQAEPDPIVAGDLKKVTVKLVEKGERKLCRWYIDQHHYLGCQPIIGEQLLYWILLDRERVGCICWASASMNSPHRERYVGWDKLTKNKNLYFVISNNRFLIFPWVKVPNLATRVLSISLKRLSSDWEKTYNHSVYLAETFVDTSRFHGTCYKASNWIYLGQTRGKSKRGNRYVLNYKPKALYVYPLTRNAIKYLGDV
jgi:hypothetical protein